MRYAILAATIAMLGLAPAGAPAVAAGPVPQQADAAAVKKKAAHDAARKALAERLGLAAAEMRKAATTPKARGLDPKIAAALGKEQAWLAQAEAGFRAHAAILAKRPASESVGRKQLDDAIKAIEATQEEVRNKRQMARTQFQNFDQKQNQLFNLLSSVVKAMNEMRLGAIRNML